MTITARRMLKQRYGHVRMAAKRTALENSKAV
jgi:hypothetical protein